jgi:hypothetical protein
MMSDASSDLGGGRAGPVERDIEQVSGPPACPPPIAAGFQARIPRVATRVTGRPARLDADAFACLRSHVVPLLRCLPQLPAVVEEPVV